MYPFGSVQEYVAPAVVVTAVKFKVLPEHKGLLLPAVGASGAAGLTKVNGPTAFEVQPFMEAVIPE